MAKGKPKKGKKEKKKKPGGTSPGKKVLIGIIVGAIVIGLIIWAAFFLTGPSEGNGGAPTPTPVPKCSQSLPGTVCVPNFVATEGVIATSQDVAEIQKEFGELPTVDDGQGGTRDLQEGDDMTGFNWKSIISDAEIESRNDRLYISLTIKDPNRRVLVSTVQFGTDPFVPRTLSGVQTTNEDAPSTGSTETETFVGAFRYNAIMTDGKACVVCN